MNLVECKKLKNGNFSAGRKLARKDFYKNSYIPTKFKVLATYCEDSSVYYNYYTYSYNNNRDWFVSKPQEFIEILQNQKSVFRYPSKMEVTWYEKIWNFEVFLKKDWELYIFSWKILFENQSLETKWLKLFGNGKDWLWALTNSMDKLYFFYTQLPKKLIEKLLQENINLTIDEFSQFQKSQNFDLLLDHVWWFENMDEILENYKPKEVITISFDWWYSQIVSELKIFYDEQKNNLVDINDYKYFLKWDDSRRYIKNLEWKIIPRNFVMENDIRDQYKSFFQEHYDMHDWEWNIFTKNVDGSIDNFFDKIDELIGDWIEIHYMQNTKKFTSKAISVNVSVDNNIDWFDINVEVSIWDEKIDEYELIFEAFESGQRILTLKNGMTILIKEDMKKLAQELNELWIDKKNVNQTKKISKYNIWLLKDKISDSKLKYQLDKEVLKFKQQLSQFTWIQDQILPKNFKATLRDYQIIGYNWLNFLQNYNFSWILADDMWLWKTVQTIALLCKNYEDKNLKIPSLIICPTSLTFNWLDELDKFTTKLKVHRIDNGIQWFDNIPKWTQIILISYWIMSNLIKQGLDMFFHYIILDESQNIKNSATSRAQSIFQLQSKYRLALSWTPIENNLMELWSAFNFLMPGFLWNQNQFKEKYIKWDKSDLNFLSQKIKPFILRRAKEQVLKELPPKVEEIIYLEMSPKQKEFYNRLKKTYKSEILWKLETEWLNKSRFVILDALLKLRQVCLMPKLVKIEWNNLTESIKLTYIQENIDEMIQKWHTLLIFSQFTEFLSYVRDILKSKDIEYSYLDWKTKPIERKKLVESFNKGQTKVFVISLKAGWTWLNLTSADYVIHLDPRRNPAVENQATDRAHRIWQTKTVFVQKLVVRNSIEEKILELQKNKKKMVDDIFSWDFSGKLTEQDVKIIFE